MTTNNRYIDSFKRDYCLCKKAFEQFKSDSMEYRERAEKFGFLFEDTDKEGPMALKGFRHTINVDFTVKPGEMETSDPRTNRGHQFNGIVAFTSYPDRNGNHEGDELFSFEFSSQTLRYLSEDETNHRGRGVVHQQQDELVPHSEFVETIYPVIFEKFIKTHFK